ncbi:UNVERIFIED_CONTAM: O-fucosyltransferase 6 [Sesamum latifolium]|uniref:O-fucosyltransferase family protein n=1 Tax=Sesamum latifolium TaxID=2727402 RepID=A0AAW2XLM8_9LAMI
MMMKKKKIQRDYEFKIPLHILLEDLVFSRHLHLLPLLSIACACWLLLFAALSFLSPPISNHQLALNATFHDGVGIHMNVEKQNVFRIPKRGGSLGPELWTSHQSKFFYGCSDASNNFITAGMSTRPDRYLLITTSGGLNQQRTGIIDAVVAAYILNATLVVPKLDRESFWNDSSWEHCCPELQVVHLTKFDYRLSNWLDTDLQKLRCRVNYHALRFTHPILAMGRKLVERMRAKSKHFLALHLRERRQGKCPLSPEEVGVMLRALGYGNEVHIYVASGEIYGGEAAMAPLRALFPNLHTKESMGSKQELAEFSAYSSRMAALDFVVCDQSDVFVTNNNGNMAK